MAHTPLRVLHVASGDLWAGAEVQLYNLACALKNRDDLRVHVLLLNDGELAERLAQAGVSVSVLNEKKQGMLGLAARTVRIMGALRPHVIHSHRYKENVLASMCARQAGATCVRTVHSTPPEPQNWQQRLIYGADDLCANRAKAVIAVSPELVNAMTERYPRASIHVIENGIDVDSVRAARDLPVDEQQIGKGFRVGFVGRLVDIKRPDLFLAIAHSLRQSGDFSFHLFGDGPLRARLEHFVDDHHLTNVRFLGFRPELTAWLSRMDALVISSDHEGLPMVALEAMALEVPIVTHAVGALPMVLDGGRCGTLIRDQEPEAYALALRALVADPVGARTRATAALKRVRSLYSSSRCAARHASLYAAVRDPSYKRQPGICYD